MMFLRSARKPLKRRPTLESLEGRQLMSLAAELPGTINTKTDLFQGNSDSATNSSGQTVVVWQDTFSPTDQDIKAQLYNSAGVKVGSEIIVAYSSAVEYQPSVSIDSRGNFVVAYSQLAGNNVDVMARRFAANGTPAGSAFPIALPTAYGQTDSDPHVAMDDRDNIVVSYTDYSPAQGHTGVVLKRLDAANHVTGAYAIGNSNHAVSDSSVSMTPDGRFVVAYEQEYSASDHDIYAEGFSSTGVAQWIDTVAYSAAYDQTPSVSVANNGNVAVAWVGGNIIKARQIGAAGVMGSELIVAYKPNDTVYDPTVAVNKTTGNFVVVYEDSGYYGDITELAEVTPSSGVITYSLGGAHYQPSVSIDASGNYFVTYTANDGIHADGNIHGRRGHLA